MPGRDNFGICRPKLKAVTPAGNRATGPSRATLRGGRWPVQRFAPKNARQHPRGAETRPGFPRAGLKIVSPRSWRAELRGTIFDTIWASGDSARKCIIRRLFAGPAALGDQTLGVVRILDVLVTTIAARVTGDELVVEVDADPVGIGFDRQSTVSVCGRDRILR
jgi:hypothetical protein